MSDKTEKTETWAIVPVKRFAAAKGRLAPVLDRAERAQLARLMFEEVLDALVPCRDILTGTVVVTADEDAATLARGRGAEVVADTADNGINAAVRLAMKYIGGKGDAGVIVVPADIPQLSSGIVAEAAATISAPRSLTLVPATEDGGTNLFACRPVDAIPPCFGPHSFRRHCRVAAQAGIAPHPLAAAELGIDIDRPENLGAFLALETKTRTHAFLAAMRIGERLEQYARLHRPLLDLAAAKVRSRVRSRV